MCLAQGPQRSDAGEAWTRGLLVLRQALYHWATVLPMWLKWNIHSFIFPDIQEWPAWISWWAWGVTMFGQQAGKYFMNFFVVCWLSKNSFRSTIRVLISLNPVWARRKFFWASDLSHCLQFVIDNAPDNKRCLRHVNSYNWSLLVSYFLFMSERPWWIYFVINVNNEWWWQLSCHCL